MGTSCSTAAGVAPNQISPSKKSATDETSPPNIITTTANVTKTEHPKTVSAAAQGSENRRKSDKPSAFMPDSYLSSNPETRLAEKQKTLKGEGLFEHVAKDAQDKSVIVPFRNSDAPIRSAPREDRRYSAGMIPTGSDFKLDGIAESSPVKKFGTSSDKPRGSLTPGARASGARLSGASEEGGRKMSSKASFRRSHSTAETKKELTELGKGKANVAWRVHIMKRNGAVGAGGEVDRRGSAVTRRRQGGLRGEGSEDNLRLLNAGTAAVKTVHKAPGLYAMLEHSLREHSIFQNMETGQIRSVVDCMTPQYVRVGEALTTQGKPGNNWYTIEQGSFMMSSRVNADSEDDVNVPLGMGDSFGEVFLLNCPKVFTVTATTAGKVWVITRTNYKNALMLYEKKKFKSRLNFLRRVPLLSGLTSDELSRLSEVVQLEHFHADQYVMHAGDAVDAYSKFYIINKGEVEVILQDKAGVDISSDINLRQGEFFGERGLLTDEPRLASVRANSAVTCLVLDRFTFTKVLGPLETVLDRSIQAYGEIVLKAVPVLADLTPAERNAAAKEFETLTFEPGVAIIKSGCASDYFYIIKEGQVNYHTPCSIAAKDMSSLISKDASRTASISERSGGHRSSLASTAEGGEGGRLSATKSRGSGGASNVVDDDTIDAVYVHTEESYANDEPEYGDDVKEASLLMPGAVEDTEAPEGVDIVDGTTGGDMTEAVDFMDSVDRSTMEAAAPMTEAEEALSNNQAVLFKGDYFGFEAVSEGVSPWTYTASTLVQCLCLPKDKFASLVASKSTRPDILGHSGLTRMKSSAVLTKHKSSLTMTPELAVGATKAPFKSLTELKYICALGKGAYGVVRLFEYSKPKIEEDIGVSVSDDEGHPSAPSSAAEEFEFFAVKCMDKVGLGFLGVSGEKGNKSSIDTALKERKTLSSLIAHPFIPKYYGTAADNHRLYFIMEFIPGGELWSLLYDKTGLATPMPEEKAKFYVASLVLVLMHLHKQSIVYRDLKPENVMLGEDGYIKLVDYGFSKQVKSRAWTLCGTPYYLAPEVLSCLGHNTSCDWWSLGVLTYELIYGLTPFHGEDVFHTFALVLNSALKFPMGPGVPKITPDCKKFITDLLSKKRNLRLGADVLDEERIVKHPFFNSIDMKAILEKKIPAPVKPVVDMAAINAKRAAAKPSDTNAFFRDGFGKRSRWIQPTVLRDFPTFF